MLRVIFLSGLLVVTRGAIQPSVTIPDTAAGYAQQVVDVFQTAYGAYLQYAKGHDDLAPVSKSFVDGRNGWQATVWDALDTMQLMGLDTLYDQALGLITNVNFTRSLTSDAAYRNHSVFESNIRYLGGALSTFELTGKTNTHLIDQVTVLTDRMAYAFDAGPVPFNEVDFSTDPPTAQFGTSNIAQVGTLTLEFSRLSVYTGNDTYRQLAENAVKAVMGQPTPLPGFPAQGIDPPTGTPDGDYVSWGGGSDSYLEYLLKYARITNNADPTFLNAWKQAVDTSIQYLLTQSSVGNWTYLTDFTGGAPFYISSHLACFHGGNWLLGGKLLNNDTIFNIGLKLVDACTNTYHSTPTGFGPEFFTFINVNGASSLTPSSDDLAFYDEHGFWIFPGETDYFLRPEVLESNFYAWRMTGDVKYFNNAVAALDSVTTYLKANAGYAGLNDVTNPSAGMIDDMESFFSAETLKYLYLTFSPFDKISLDEYVFNTEAHPYEAPVWTH
ncbi:seven-hairpin glycosidase [Dacryopinax primogenitus]|uniref:alpha-1,2-Mannosidase n=1 Tax=Dacryopinax primogenitus (strain DJM 731) TaxID=1858805 RepID=M5FXR2_DACPD|nr:seven-hairpin glycosidase [Dacryopinax primogenitus]EJT98306.1 seven-hairpin glycosidase [Dacryopinax primogenitus]